MCIRVYCTSEDILGGHLGRSSRWTQLLARLEKRLDVERGVSHFTRQVSPGADLWLEWLEARQMTQRSCMFLSFGGCVHLQKYALQTSTRVQ